MNSNEIKSFAPVELTITDHVIKSLPAAAARWLIEALAEQQQIKFHVDDMATISALAVYLFDDEKLPDATQQAAIALKHANVISDIQFVMLLSMYIHDKQKNEDATQYEDLRSALTEQGFTLMRKKNIFLIREPAPDAAIHELPDLNAVQIFYNAIEAVTRKTKRYTLPELLAQCQSKTGHNEVLQEWLNTESVGHEIVADQPYVPVLFEPDRFIEQLHATLTAIDRQGQPLEITDLANEIGVLLGCAISDKAALKRDFRQGFVHGVELTNRSIEE